MKTGRNQRNCRRVEWSRRSPDSPPSFRLLVTLFRSSLLALPSPVVYLTPMLWRTSKPASRKHQPEGFLIPSQPTLSDRPPTGPKWIHEIKHDGYRLIAIRQNGVVRLWSRRATNFTDTFTRIGEAVAGLPGGDIIIDGEAVALRSDMHSDFYALRSKSSASHAVLVGFDLLHIDGHDVRKSPLEERRELLAGRIAGRDGLQFSEAVEGDGEVIFKHACAMGMEGIVSKRLGKPYSPGRCAHWIKTINPNFNRR